MVLVGGHAALVGCAVAVRTSDGAVAGEGLRACGRSRKVVMGSWQNKEQPIVMRTDLSCSTTSSTFALAVKS